MILMVFCVFDAASSAFLPPFTFQTRGQAVRSFSDAVNEEGHQFKRHASDYTLFYVGDFDQVTGLLRPLDTPESCGIAVQFLELAHGDQTPMSLEA